MDKIKKAVGIFLGLAGELWWIALVKVDVREIHHLFPDLGIADVPLRQQGSLERHIGSAVVCFQAEVHAQLVALGDFIKPALADQVIVKVLLQYGILGAVGQGSHDPQGHQAVKAVLDGEPGQVDTVPRVFIDGSVERRAAVRVKDLQVECLSQAAGPPCTLDHQTPSNPAGVLLEFLLDCAVKGCIVPYHFPHAAKGGRPAKKLVPAARILPDVIG